MTSGSPYHHDQIGDGHRDLCDHGAPGRSGDPEAAAVDQSRVEGAVGGEASDGDVERGPGVLEPAENAGRCQHHEHGRDAEAGDPQICDRVGGCCVGGAEDIHQPGGRGEGDGDDGDAQQDRQPDAVHALPDRGGQITRPDPPCHCRGGGVGEEDEDADGSGQQGGGDGQAYQLRGTEMSDDGAVDHDEERLGDECAEGGYGERDDLAVVPSTTGWRGRRGLGHGGQSNLPQVIDAMA